MFPAYGGSVCRVKRFSVGGEIFHDDEDVGEEVAETTIKRFLCSGFDTLTKRWDKCINAGGGYVEK
jgi:hypothetical protein